MAKSEYSKTFGVAEGTWVWCLHCERAYKVGEFRKIDGLQMCPYDDCDGDAVMDPWPWKRIVELRPEYPKKPVRGEFYPLHVNTK